MKTMNQNVLLILVDGMRPDAIAACDHPFLRELRKSTASTWNASTVMPSITLPCHASLFFSVDPSRHGITTNTWMPQVRPIDSIADAANKAGKRCAMFSNWEELRDLNRPGSLDAAIFCRIKERYEESDWALTRCAQGYIQTENPNFVFLSKFCLPHREFFRNNDIGTDIMKHFQNFNSFCKSPAF